MGQIFVSTGLLRLTETDSQLAVVLAHEISHALLSHGVRALQNFSSYFSVSSNCSRCLAFGICILMLPVLEINCCM